MHTLNYKKLIKDQTIAVTSVTWSANNKNKWGLYCVCLLSSEWARRQAQVLKNIYG